MVKWLELSVAICLLLVVVLIVIPTLIDEKTPYQDCLDNCLSCSNDNYYIFKEECSVCIDLCKQKYNATEY